jgi:hypothetical protein
MYSINSASCTVHIAMHFGCDYTTKQNTFISTESSFWKHSFGLIQSRLPVTIITIPDVFTLEHSCTVFYYFFLLDNFQNS